MCSSFLPHYEFAQQNSVFFIQEYALQLLMSELVKQLSD
ncbi:hypothetical protein GAGA_3128 [Paraglaciecola agarilytica NO2]|uniref:Uncharacterized protein n=1 Tax=Paraglaciecola agarilytica NO2 TaxID=1125747 RepID=A0ABQ0I9C2_9ALTE|nr:hypothetical protein GAGA_3128 [Paraglaciecola agarilytica NO2]